MDRLGDQGGRETSGLAGSLGWVGVGLWDHRAGPPPPAEAAAGGQGSLGGVVRGVRAEQDQSRNLIDHSPDGVIVLR